MVAYWHILYVMKTFQRYSTRLVIVRVTLTTESWYRRCNNIVSYEFLGMRRTCDYLVECALLRAV